MNVHEIQQSGTNDADNDEPKQCPQLISSIQHHPRAHWIGRNAV